MLNSSEKFVRLQESEIEQRDHCFRGDEKERPHLRPSNLLEKITYCHTHKIISAGNKKPYSEDMLFQVDQAFRFEEPHIRFVNILNSEGEGRLGFGTIMKYSLPFTGQLSVSSFINSVFSILTAYITSKLIDWIQRPKPKIVDGLFLTIFSIVSIFLKVLAYNWYYVTYYQTEKNLLNGLRVKSRLFISKFELLALCFHSDLTRDKIFMCLYRD